jgi:hypothetical protein
MPTSKELVSNKPLQSTELAAIILSDVRRLVDGSCLLTGQIAYSRVAYELRLTLHLDLPAIPTSIDSVLSRAQATDAIAAAPALAAIEPGPRLADPSPAAVLQSTGLKRDIDSPNLARIAHSLPIEVSTMGQDGHVQEHLVDYTPSDVGMRADQFPEPDLSDVTEEMRKELGL